MHAQHDPRRTKNNSSREIVRAEYRAVGPGGEARQKRLEIEVGDIKIDIRGHRVFVRKKEVNLTPKEFDLLVYFARHPQKLIARTVLLRSIWGEGSVNRHEYLRVLIGQLRKKLESGTNKHYIVTQPWIGYRFTPG